jgi:hypothetical protein
MSLVTTPSKAQIGLGSQIFIGPATAGISGTPTFVLIGEVTKITPSGSKAQVVKWNTIDRLNTQKRAGVRDAGATALEIARVADDAGQVALAAAYQTDQSGQPYRFQVVIPADAADSQTVATTIQVDAIVSEYNPFAGISAEGLINLTASIEQINDWTVIPPSS